MHLATYDRDKYLVKRISRVVVTTISSFCGLVQMVERALFKPKLPQMIPASTVKKVYIVDKNLHFSTTVDVA